MLTPSLSAVVHEKLAEEEIEYLEEPYVPMKVSGHT